ncbi:MAG TPA: VWA domain-containing protein [Pyrinomonadaceae bacterium]|jgi:VWFA-related protein|nr:VWA domain-containing protein [Pyrinomonadaceae bacterium]
MKHSVTVLLAIALGLSVLSPIGGQTPQNQDDVIRIRSNEVKLDIVVKDKKGRSVKDLTAADFEVLEDGVSQRIASFRFVNREGPRETATPSSPDRKDTNVQSLPVPSAVLPNRTTPGVIALVFDRLSPEARTLAKKAGIAYALEGMAGGDFTGVFRIDLSLNTVQHFTDNSELVKAAIDTATSASGSTFASSAQRTRDLADRSSALDRQIDSSQAAAVSAGASGDGGGAAAAGQAAGQAAAAQKLVEMESNILQQFEALERDQQGFATINGLLAVINPMRNLPGRKTIIFFSEGLSLPTSVQTKFPAVISAANRANVSIYTIDAAGLRTESGTAESARELNSIVAQRIGQQGRGSDRGSSGPYMKSLERNEELLRFDPRSGLGQLADQTGGFLIHDTNDLANGVRRINDDMHGYYMVTYVPKNEDYNGQFRQISVKLNRPSLEIQARKGYYAVESVGQLPILDYEAPAIAAARNADPNSKVSQFKGSALSFPEPNRSGLSLVVAEAPLSAFSFVPSSDNKTYNANFAIVALVRDQAGQVIQKVSQHYPLSGPLETLADAKKGVVLFYRETLLSPGSYTVELIAYDGSNGQTSVRKTGLKIPNYDDTQPRLSSVAVLRRAERLTPEEQKRNQPFHFGELLVYPNLGEPILKSVTQQLAFFFTAWPAKGSTTTLQLSLEILQNNRSLAQTSGQLPNADELGQIKYASSFPLDKFQPGSYELKVTVGDGKNSVNRSTNFTIAP